MPELCGCLSVDTNKDVNRGIANVFVSTDETSIVRAKSRCTTALVFPFLGLCALWLLFPASQQLLSVSRRIAWFFLLGCFIYGVLRTFIVFRINPPGILTDISYFFFDFLAILGAVFITGGERSPFVICILISVVATGIFFNVWGTVLISLLAGLFLVEVSFLSHIFFSQPFHFLRVLFMGLFILFVGLITAILAESERRERRLRIGISKTLFDCLSGREKLVLKLLVEGKTNLEIATLIDRDVKTVRNFLSSLYRKLGVKNRYELQLLGVLFADLYRDQEKLFR